MTPMTYERYAELVATYLRIAREIRAEAPDADLSHELHQWLNAPDSFFSWHDGTTEEVAREVLTFTRHPDAAPDADTRTDEVEYLAAWAFVADVLALLDAPICPCYCHASKEALVSADEGLASTCECTAECIRGEARELDFNDRDELVAWLIENDRNGCHADDEFMEELGRIHDLASARESYCVVMGIHESWVGK